MNKVYTKMSKMVTLPLKKQKKLTGLLVMILKRLSFFFCLVSNLDINSAYPVHI